MGRQIDRTKPLSDEDREFLSQTSTVEEMRYWDALAAGNGEQEQPKEPQVGEPPTGEQTGEQKPTGEQEQENTGEQKPAAGDAKASAKK